MLPSPTRPSPTRPSPTRPSPTRPSSARPGTEPRHFVKSRPQAALVGDTGGHSGPSEDSAQESNSRHSVTCPAPRSRELHHCPVSPQDTSPAQPQSSLSPSCLSSCPPCVSPSPLSLSSSVGSACGDVRSLEELFPLEESNSDRSDTGHFRMNLVDLEDLGPAALVLKEEEVPEEVPEEEPEEVPEEELEEEVPEEELEEEVPEEELQEEIEEVEYPTDFESPSEGPSQDSGQPPSPRSQSSYSNTFSRATISDPSSPEATSQPNSPLPQPDALLAKASKDPAGQTFHLPAAHGGPCPSMGLLVESLRQQLALTSHFINSSQEHHTQALGGLGPPNYRYTTLEDTLKSISTLRASRPRSDQKTQRR
ncbi:uncharacterized protein C19orf44 homolog [Eucyclogobius newberryi]|uniref:uncharacterized protein C19orf44 homolog n=1 Tax=Eucyclogobius newberryi TaxID=166745 RepID=UPI003B5B39A2